MRSSIDGNGKTKMRNPIRLLRYFFAGWLPGGRHYCVMCNHHVWRFMPYGDGTRVGLMEALAIVGSDIRNFECPRCGAHDRERHLLMYLQASGYMDTLSRMRILHFAPERNLSRRIAAMSPSAYVLCDLYPAAPGIKRVDIEAMPFGDAEFDLIVANHVLEHVEDDRRAIAEIQRVLASDGFAILQTPYSQTLHHTWSDPGILCGQARRQAYGQEDHARLFGRDIIERFAATGLNPVVRTHAELLQEIDPVVTGVNQHEPFLLFRKSN